MWEVTPVHQRVPHRSIKRQVRKVVNGVKGASRWIKRVCCTNG